MVDFADYPTVLLRMLNNCIKEPHIHLAVFVMQPTGDARLDFIQVRAASNHGIYHRGWVGPCSIIHASIWASIRLCMCHSMLC